MATNTEISKLFITLFNRATDANTFGVLANQPLSPALVQSLLGGTYNQELGIDNSINTLSNRAFVETLYKNALGKEPGDDVEGINYWVSLLEGNADANIAPISKADLVVAFVTEMQRYEDAANGSGTLTLTLPDGTQREYTLTDKDRSGIKVFDAKVAISDAASASVGKVDDPFYLTFGAGLSDITAANVDSVLADKEFANNALNDVKAQFPVADPGASGDITGTTPTDKDDTFNAVVGGANPTLKTDTVLDGGAGNDTLKVDMQANFNGLTGSGAISNVEVIDLTNNSRDNLTFIAQSITGANTYNLRGENGINLENVAHSNSLAINIIGAKNSQGTSIRFDDKLTDTSKGRLTMRLENVGTDTTKHNINLSNGIDELRVNVVGNNYSDLSGNMSKISVGGSGSFTTNLGQSVNYFNASNVQGNVKVTAGALQTGTTNTFSKIATGNGRDEVSVDVNRLGRDTLIDLGNGEDTLTFTGAVSDSSRKYYDLSSVENLVFNTTAANLSLDLGRSKFSGGDTNVTTNDRSANLKNVTVESGADVELRELGSKDLNVTHKGTAGLSMDHAGKTTLTIGGDTNNSGSGTLNFSNTNALTVNVTGTGFSGVFSAGKATDLTIVNLTNSGSFTIIPPETGISDLRSVSKLTINTDSNGGVNLAGAALNALGAATIVGKGTVTFGALSNSGGLTLNAEDFTGKLVASSINTGAGALDINTSGSLQITGNDNTAALAGSNIKINLAGSNEMSHIGRIDLTGNSASLDYTTSVAGTRSALTPNNANYEQTINLLAQRSTIKLTGQSADDRFLFTGKATTENVILSGDLGVGRNQVSVDLSDSNGVTVDLRGLNAGADGRVEILGSEGKDTITLAKDLNKDVFGAVLGSAATTAQAEVATINVAAMSGGASLTINGLTLAAKENATDAEVAAALANILTTGNLAATDTKFSTSGTFDSGEFNAREYATINAAGGTITLTGAQNKNLEDIDNVLDLTVAQDATAANNITVAPTDGDAGQSYSSGDATDTFLSSALQGTAPTRPTANTQTATGTGTGNIGQATATSGVTVKLANGSDTLDIKILATSSQTVTASNVSKIVAAILEGRSTTGATNILQTSGITLTGTWNGVTYSATTDIINATATGTLSVKSGATYAFGKDITPGWDIAVNETTNTKLDVSANITTPPTTNMLLKIGTGTPIVTTAGATVSGAGSNSIAQATSSEATVVKINNGTDTLDIGITATASATVTAANVAKVIAAILDGGSAKVANTGIKATDGITLSGKWGDITFSANTDKLSITATGTITAAVSSAYQKGTDLTPGWNIGGNANGTLEISPIAGTPASAPLTLKVGTNGAPVTANVGATVGEYTIGGLKDAATNTTGDTIKIKITTASGTRASLSPTDAAKVVAAIIENDTSVTGVILSGNIARIELDTAGDGTSYQSIYTGTGENLSYTSATDAKDYTGASWKMTTDAAGKLRLEEATVGANPDYSMTVTVMGNNTGGSAGVTGTGQTTPTPARVELPFAQLEKGQTFSYDGVTLAAIDTLTAKEVADAFAARFNDGNLPSDLTGKAIINGSYATLTSTNGFSAASFAVDANGKLTITQTTAGTVTGFDALTTIAGGSITNPSQSDFVAQVTTDGSDGNVVKSHSYVEVKGANLDITHMDEITNFQVGVDKIYGFADKDAVNPQLLSIGTASDLSGATQVKEISLNGIVTFDETAQRLTIKEKFEQLQSLAQNKFLAFEDSGNTYVIVGGGSSGDLVDDLSIKLVGVTGVTDAGALIG